MAKRMAVKKPQNKEREWPKLGFSFPENYARPIAIICLTIVIVVGLYWLSKVASLTSSIWPIEKISFAGSAERINKEALIGSLELKKNNGMLSIDLQAVRRKVLENPWVESIEVRKQWPDTLFFTLQEKQPIAIFNQGYLLANGKVVATPVLPQDLDSLLTVSMAKVENLEPEKLIDITELLASISQRLTKHSFSVSGVEIDSSESWNIKTASGFSINAGRKNQLQRLDRFLQVYVAIENKKQLSSVDLRYRNGLAVELKSNTNSEEG